MPLRSWIPAFLRRHITGNSPLIPWFLTAAFIALLAIVSRLAQLGQVPTGLTWDEAALGYVGKMIWLTGHDEYGQALPLTFTSFGDFKSPLAFYFTGLSTVLFGLSAWAVRLPYAVAGVLSVAAMGILIWQLMRERWYALLGSFFLVTLPWHFYFSRVGFESGVALLGFLLLLGGWLGWLRLQPNKPKWQKLLWPTMMIAGTVINAYTYHSGKIVLPLTWGLLTVSTWLWHRDWWQRHWRWFAATLLSVCVLLLPLIWEMIQGPGLGRATQTSFLTQQPLWQSLGLIGKNLITHLSLGFLVEGESSTLRHSGGEYGVLLYSQLALFWLGMTFALGRAWQGLYRSTRQGWWEKWWQKMQRHLNFRSTYQSPLLPSWWWFLLLLVTLLPAAIGYEVPHANRALLAVVPVVTLSVLGVRELQEELDLGAFAAVFGMLLLFVMLEWSVFWRYYFTAYAAQSSEAWLEGYQEASQAAHEFTLKGYSLKMSDSYGQPAMFYAFYNQIPVEQYQASRIPEVQFGNISVDDLNHFEVLITSPEDALPLPVSRTITRTDGSTAFLIYETY